MSKVFIGGSRRVSRLGISIRARLDKVIEKGLPVLIGDANGADKAVQQYLFSKNHRKVEVFCSGSACRNNVGGWPTRQIEAGKRSKGLDFYVAKDRAMALEAELGFMVWDGKSKGTLLNVLRLLRQNKKVVVYIVTEQVFSELRGYEHWDSFIAQYGAELRNQTEQRVALEERSDRQPSQSSLFPAPPA